MREPEKTEHAKLFSIGARVEVTSDEDGFKNAWFPGTIVDSPKSKPNFSLKKRAKKNVCWVEYDNLLEEKGGTNKLVELAESSYIRPAPPSSVCLADEFNSFKLDDVVEACYRDGWWTGVIIKVLHNGLKYLVAFECPREERIFEEKELRVHLDWNGGKWNNPKTKEVVLDITKTTEVDIQLARISCEFSNTDMLPSTKKLKQATVDTEGIQTSKRFRKENAIEPSQILSSCAFNSVSTPTSREEAHCNVKGDSSIKCHLNSAARTEDKSQKRKRRGRPPKKAVQGVLKLRGEGLAGDGSPLHEKAIKLEATSEADLSGVGKHISGGSHEVENGAGNKDSEILPVGKVCEVYPMSDGTNEVEMGTDEQGGCLSKALTAYVEPINQHGPCPAILPTIDNPSDKCQSWPFVKRSGMWKTIDSMELFKRMSMMPHFAPLNEYDESLREKLAIDLMMNFAYEVDRISRFAQDDLKEKSIISNCMDGFKRFEAHGYNITAIQVRLNQLLLKIERKNELQEELEKVELEITKYQDERNAIEKQMSQLVEKMKFLQEKIESAGSAKYLKEQQLSTVQSEKDIVSGEIRSLQLGF